ncbi:MAG: hypothetical protein HZA50_01250 [Planctomycetes bacterium]|nr:hypothetical protein [Planctomycetota bacterium]
MSNATVDIPTSSSVPAPIRGLLTRLVRRARMLALLRGILATAAAGGGSLLAIMALDAAVVIESAWPRWAMSLSALGLTLLTAILFVVLPLLKSRGLAWAARVIETRHPELQERLSSAVELLTSSDGPELKGSAALVAALAAQASGDAVSLRPAREISLGRAVPYLAAAGACAAALAAVLLFWPDQARLLLARAVAPQSEPGNILAWQIRIIDPPGGDATIASDQKLQVQVELAEPSADAAGMKVRPLDSSAGPPDLSDGGRMTYLGRSDNGLPRFGLTMPPTARSFAYHIRSGRAISAEHVITVIDRPRVVRLDVRYDYPAYTGRATETGEVSDGRIRAIAGTGATLLARLNKSVVSAWFAPAGGKNQPAQAEMRTGQDGSAICVIPVAMSPAMSGKRSLRFQDSAGLTSEPLDLEFFAEPDNPPTVRLVEPADSAVRMRPDDRLPLAWLAGDDVGLARIDILLEADGRELPGINLFDAARIATQPTSGAATQPAVKAAAQAALKDARPVSLSGRHSLDLAMMDLRGAARLKVCIRALDNLPADRSGPQAGLSSPLIVILDSATPWLAQQAILAEELRIRQTLQAALRELQAVKRDSEPLCKEAGATGDIARQALARADRVRDKCSRVDADLRSLSGQLAGGTYDSWAVRLASLADEHVGRAAILVAQIAQAQRPDSRADLADETDFQIDRSIQIVTDMLAELGVLTELAIRASEIRELSHRQESLAEEKTKQEQAAAAASQSASRPDQSASQPAGDSGRMSNEQWKQEQQALADRLAQMARERDNQRSRQNQLPQAQKRPENQPPAERDLAGDLRQAARKQAELIADSSRLAELKAADDELANLAGQQKALGDEAGKEKPAAIAGPKMSAAADDIRAGKLASAIGQQQEAHDQLSRTAKQLKESKELADLSGKAAELAKSQTGLATAAKQAASEQAAAKQAAQQAAGKIQQGSKDVQDANRRSVEANAAAGQAAKKVEQTAKDVQDAQRRLDEAIAASKAATQQAANTGQNPATQPAAQKVEQANKDALEAKRRLDEAVAANKSATQQATAAGDNKNQKDAADALEKAKAALAGDQAVQAKADQAAAQARQKLDELSRSQQELAKQAGEIRDRLAKAPGGSEVKTNPIDAMNKSAQALSGQDAGAAAKLTDEAAAQTGKAAAEIKQAAGQADPARAPAVEKLAERQAELKKKTQDAAARRDSIAQQVQGSQAKRLADRQQQIAGETARLADDVKKTVAQEDRIETAAARNTQQAARRSAEGANEQAAKHAAQAAKQIKELAKRLGADEKGSQPAQAASAPASTPAGDVKASQTLEEKAETPRQALAKKAAELAKEQTDLAWQLDALAKRQPAAVAAKEQAGLAEQTDRIQKDVKNLQDHAEGIVTDAEAKKELDKAADLVDKANQQQREAGQALDTGQPTKAGPAQRSSAKALSDAADSLEKMGRKLAQTAADSPEQDAQLDQAMNESQQSAQEAALSQAEKDALKAARQLAKLSRIADSQARMAGINTDDPTGMSDGMDPSGGSLGLTPEQTAEALKSLGVSYEDWARLPGKLKDDVLQAAQADGPTEYRDLIRKYFQEIARRAGLRNGVGK